jgi:hypothetical protein
MDRTTRVRRAARRPKPRGSKHEIVSVADNGSGNPRYTTASAHGLTTGRNVEIKGTPTAGPYDGVISPVVVSATTFDALLQAFDGDKSVYWEYA